MKKIVSIDTDHIDHQNLQHIQVHFEGVKKTKTVALYDLDSHKVIFKDDHFITNERVKDALREIKGDLKPRFPDGFISWKETFFECVDAICQEQRKDNPTGTVHERNEAEGMGGLYMLAEELTAEFEQIHRGHEWEGGDYWPEIETFLKIKLYQPQQIYKPSYVQK